MSQRNRNHRAATLCSKATGTRYRKCLAWENKGLISVRQPVPDAVSHDQCRFEAMIALTLAEAFRDSQLDGALLGLNRVEPRLHGIELYPHPDMAKRLVRQLLPRLVGDDDGDFQGVPGLRPSWQRDAVTLRDLASSAQARVIWPEGAPPPEADFKLTDRELWRRGPMDDEEERDRDRWTGLYEGRRFRSSAELGVRDMAMSRILRRVALVNRGASPHGFANTYSHSRRDLIIESCCGTDPEESKRLLVQSGIADPVEDPLFGLLEPSVESEGPIDFGDSVCVTFRCRGVDKRIGAHDVPEELIDQLRREWYS